MAELVANFELNNIELTADMELSTDNIDADFVINAEGTTWGNIYGDINNQTDLINTIDNKVQEESTVINGRIDSEVERLEDEIHDATLDIQGSDLIGVETQKQTVTITSKTFVFEQGIPAKEWVINHNLNKRPSVDLAYYNGERFEGYREYPNNNQVIIKLDAAASGYAYLN